MYSEKTAKTIQANSMQENQMVVSMYAQKTEDGDLNTNISITSQTFYEAYKEECDADIATFKAHVEAL